MLIVKGRNKIMQKLIEETELAVEILKRENDFAEHKAMIQLCAAEEIKEKNRRAQIPNSTDRK